MSRHSRKWAFLRRILWLRIRFRSIFIQISHRRFSLALKKLIFVNIVCHRNILYSKFKFSILISAILFRSDSSWFWFWSIDCFLLILRRTQQKVFSDLNEFHNVTVSNICSVEKRHVFSLQKNVEDERYANFNYVNSTTEEVMQHWLINNKRLIDLGYSSDISWNRPALPGARKFLTFFL